MAKMKDVAQLAGVSVATVSNVFTGKHHVSPETRERVLSAVEDLNYHLNLYARGLKVSQSKTIGVVLPNMTKLYFNEIMRGILETAEQSGFQITVQNSYYDFSVERECISTLRGYNVDAIILDTVCSSEQLKSWTGELSPDGCKTPVVFLENPVDEQLGSSVTVDFYYWAYQVTKHLIELGKSRILYLSGPSYLLHEQDRLSGYTQALKDHGLPFLKDLVIANDFSTESGFHTIAEAQRHHLQFDAVQATSDEAAIGAIQALLDAGVRIPEEVAVCGFDDLFPATLITPSLTTVHVPRFEIGQQSVLECLHHLSDPALSPRKTVLNANLVIRESTVPGKDTRWLLNNW